MHQSTVRRLAIVLAAFGGASCGGGDSTGPGDNGQLRFAAKIDGVVWASTAGVERIGVPSVLPGVFTLTGVNTGGATVYTIVMALYNIPGPGTYPLGVGVSVPGGNVLISSTVGGWRTAQTGADGTITITTLTSSRMEGTFSFTAIAFSGNATGTKTVTDGSFILDVKPQGTVGPLPDNAGSKVSATLNGAAFNGADVSGSYSASNTGILTIIANNSTRSLSISLTGVPATGVGTYALSNGSPTRTLGVTTLTNNQLTGIYSSVAAGSSGTVTVTSFTATRMKGTFTAAIGAAGSGATGTIQITNGTFDIGR